MLKKETIGLLDKNNVDFREIFSICAGKSFLYQVRFKEYVGKCNQWHTELNEGILKLDDRIFNVEYIGTTSTADNFWFSSVIESMIPDEYVNLMINTKKIMQSLNLSKVTENKIELSNEINGDTLSMIYSTFAPENVTYFCGLGATSIYMFVKNLPENMFKKMNSVEFSNRVMEIISTFNVKHKLMVKALLIENEIEYSNDQNNIVAKFNDNSILTVEFDNNDFIRNISGKLCL